MGKDHTVHVGPAWRVLLQDLGLDEVTVLRRAGQPPTLLLGESAYISLEDYYALHEAVAREANDSTIALRAGQVLSAELFEPALFSALCSPDMNVAASRLGQFKRMVGAFTLDVDIDEVQTRVRYRCKHRPDLPAAHGLTEMVFLVALIRRATRHDVAPRRVTVQELPEALAPYAGYFRCEVREGDAYAVAFEAVDASRPFLTHNNQMWAAFEPGLRRRMANADAARSATEQVETALFELLPSGRTEMKDVAKEIGIGTRTLQRRLATEGTTWLTVLGQTRERLARHYLRNTSLSPAEVSFLLGFEDPNSLFRAFQRWTGTTPESWRASQPS